MNTLTKHAEDALFHADALLTRLREREDRKKQQARRNRQPRHGSYLAEQMNRTDWHQLADRTAPLPDLPVEQLLEHFKQLWLCQQVEQDPSSWGVSPSDLERWS